MSVPSIVYYYKNKINNIKYTIKGNKRKKKPSRNGNASLIFKIHPSCRDVFL